MLVPMTNASTYDLYDQHKMQSEKVLKIVHYQLNNCVSICKWSYVYNHCWLCNLEDRVKSKQEEHHFETQ